MWLPTMFAVKTLVVSMSAALVFLPAPALSHPQCLDFAPPYDDQQVRRKYYDYSSLRFLRSSPISHRLESGVGVVDDD